eukprot:2383555-Prymnesium_polylepis.2
MVALSAQAADVVVAVMVPGTDAPSTPSCCCTRSLGLRTHRLAAHPRHTCSDPAGGTGAMPPPTSLPQTSRRSSLRYPRCSRSSPSTARWQSLFSLYTWASRRSSCSRWPRSACLRSALR